MSKMKKPLVIVHAECVDGMTAKWIFYQHFGDGAEYVFAKYGDQLPDVDGRWVIVADFSWKRPEMIDLASRAASLVVLDHHASAERELAGFADDCELRGIPRPEVVFDMTKSGCRLAWDWLKSIGAAGPMFDCPEPPVLVQYVEDADLWRWALPGSKAMSAVIRSHEQTMDRWSMLQMQISGQSELPHKVKPSSLADTIHEGEAILRAERKRVLAAVKRAVVMTVGGYRVQVVNTSVLQSDIGHELAVGYPFSATYFDDLQRGLRVWSFRSTDCGIDVGKFAAGMGLGGGGHRAAAGAQQDLSEPVSAMATKGGAA